MKTSICRPNYLDKRYFSVSGERLSGLCQTQWISATNFVNCHSQSLWGSNLGVQMSVEIANVPKGYLIKDGGGIKPSKPYATGIFFCYALYRFCQLRWIQPDLGVFRRVIYLANANDYRHPLSFPDNGHVLLKDDDNVQFVGIKSSGSCRCPNPLYSLDIFSFAQYIVSVLTKQILLIQNQNPFQFATHDPLPASPGLQRLSRNSISSPFGLIQLRSRAVKLIWTLGSFFASVFHCT